MLRVNSNPIFHTKKGDDDDDDDDDEDEDEDSDDDDDEHDDDDEDEDHDNDDDDDTDSDDDDDDDDVDNCCLNFYILFAFIHSEMADLDQKLKTVKVATVLLLIKPYRSNGMKQGPPAIFFHLPPDPQA